MGGSTSKKSYSEIILEDDLISRLKSSFEEFDKTNHGSANGKLQLSTCTLTLLNNLIDNEDSLTHASYSHRARGQTSNWRLPCGVVTAFGPAAARDIAMIKVIVEGIQHLVVSNVSGTIQGYVNIGRFSSLRFLELRNVPLHLVQNLKQFRSSLKEITVFRCVASTRILFDVCGGDQTFSADWSALTMADLQNNNLSEIDESMRLLSHLTVLDLSRNALKDAHGLQFLNCLESVNLSFNFLTNLPNFSPRTKYSLKVILVAFNSLDSLQGVERQVGLKVLDLRDNCLTLLNDLAGLDALQDLTKLRLLGNPLTTDPKYRKKMFNIICPFVNFRLELDNTPLVRSELRRLQQRRYSDTISVEDSSLEHSESSITSELGSTPHPENEANVLSMSISQEGDSSGGSDADVSSLDVEVAGYFGGNGRSRKATNKIRTTHDPGLITSSTTATGDAQRASSRTSTPLDHGTLVDSNNRSFSAAMGNSRPTFSRTLSNALYPATSFDCSDQQVASPRRVVLQWGQGSPVPPSFLLDDDSQEEIASSNRFSVWAKVSTEEALIGGEVEIAVVRFHWLVTIDPNSEQGLRVIECFDLNLLDGLKRESQTEALLSVYFRYRKMKCRARNYRFQSMDKLNELVECLQPFATPVNPATSRQSSIIHENTASCHDDQCWSPPDSCSTAADQLSHLAVLTDPTRRQTSFSDSQNNMTVGSEACDNSLSESGHNSKDCTTAVSTLNQSRPNPIQEA